MATFDETEAAKKRLAAELAGSASEPGRNSVRVSDLNVEEGGLERENTVVMNRRLVVTETTVEMRNVGQSGLGLGLLSEQQNGAEDMIVQELNSAGISVKNKEGTSFVVDVHGSLNAVNEGNLCNQSGEGLYVRNGVESDEKFRKVNGSAPILAEKSDVSMEKKGNGAVIGTEESIYRDVDDEMVDERNHDFSVGDFVWGKIRSHPWWPAQIYDPSDASDFASKFKQKDRLLVAYFGDGSCAWCYPSQLVPFAENFEGMLQQSTSRSFVNAVEKALEEIGRRSELKMTCSCLSEENSVGLARPPAKNAGVRPGVLVPEGDIDRVPAPEYEPDEVLEYLRHLAEAGSIANMLELMLVKSWLSAFYRLRRGCCLPKYHEPQLIEGLEDKSKAVVSDSNDFSVPIEVPIQGPSEEDWLSSPKEGHGKAPPVLNKLNQKRKQKTVAELLGEKTTVKLKGRKNSRGEEETPSTRVKKQKKVDSEALNESGTPQTSVKSRKRGRKPKAKISKSTQIAVDEGTQPDGDVNKSPLSTKLKKYEDSRDDIDGEATKEPEKSFMSRERKKSKYLSPPYTTSIRKGGKSSIKRELETESEKVTKLAKLGERMTKAAGKLNLSPAITKCNATGVVSRTKKQKEKKKIDSVVGHHSETDNTGVISRSKKQKEKKNIDSVDVSASVNEVLAEILAAGVDVMSLKNGFSESIKRYVAAFRSSMYLNGASYKSYHKEKAGRKRKRAVSETTNIGNLDKDIKPQPPSHSEKMERPRSRVTKLKKAARAAATEKKKKDVDKKASLVSLIVSFAPDACLPSKDEITTIFSKFGGVNGDETKLLPDSNCAQIAYTSVSDAEKAFKECIKQSPFGALNVDYRLQYSSAASRALKSGLTISASPKRKRTQKKSAGLEPKDDEISQVGFFRKNLGELTLMLDNCDGNISLEEKSELEGEVRSMLQKVNALAVRSSS